MLHLFNIFIIYIYIRVTRLLERMHQLWNGLDEGVGSQEGPPQLAPFLHLGVGAWDVLWLFCNGDTWPYRSASHGNAGGDWYWYDHFTVYLYIYIVSYFQLYETTEGRWCNMLDWQIVVTLDLNNYMSNQGQESPNESKIVMS